MNKTCATCGKKREIHPGITRKDQDRLLFCRALGIYVKPDSPACAEYTEQTEDERPEPGLNKRGEQ